MPRLKIAFLNPQGGIHADNTGLGEHPDFGGQLVYVKEVALALAQFNIDVDILTRRFEDKRWPVFNQAMEILSLPDASGKSGTVRVIRMPAGPPGFLRKEDLWPHIPAWVANIVSFYYFFCDFPNASTGHYGDGGLACVRLEQLASVPFITFTAHSLGAQKRDVLISQGKDLTQYHFDDRLAAENLAVQKARIVVVGTDLERIEQYAHDDYARSICPIRDIGRFATISPGVNLRVFGSGCADSAEGEAAAETLQVAINHSVPENRRHLPIVIVAGRLECKKNHISLVKAFASNSCLREAANLLLLLKGGSHAFRMPDEVLTGEELSLALDMLEIISDVGLDGSCLIVPGLQNTRIELAAIFRYLSKRKQGIFCHAAHYEPFGLMVLEAMAAGVTAVCTRNGGPSETLFKDGVEFAKLVDPSDLDKISKALLDLARDKEV